MGAWVKKYIEVIGNKNIYIGIPKEDQKKTKRKASENQKTCDQRDRYKCTTNPENDCKARDQKKQEYQLQQNVKRF